MKMRIPRRLDFQVNLGISAKAGIDSNVLSLKTATSLTSGNIYDSNNLPHNMKVPTY